MGVVKVVVNGVTKMDLTPTTADASEVNQGEVFFNRSGEQSVGTGDPPSSRVPVYGMGVNLIRNWYFVGGGTGRGIFPVNQRGQSSYSTPSETNIDGWRFSSSGGQINLLSNGLNVSVLSNNQNFYQELSQARDYYLSRTLTLSALTASGELYTVTGAAPSSHPSGTSTIFNTAIGTFGLLVFGYFGGSVSKYYVGFVNMSTSITTETFKAVKLELGTEQTLAHQENGVWVLNEIPDYEEELIKCQTSNADSTDTYANKSLATEQQLAYVETGTTASRAYSVGGYFCWNGLLYRVTAAISSGAAFTVGTNCEVATVGQVFGTVKMLHLSQESGVTSSSGNLNLSISPNTIIVGFRPSAQQAVDYIGRGSNGNYYCHIVNSSGDSITGTSVSVDIYYINP